MSAPKKRQLEQQTTTTTTTTETATTTKYTLEVASKLFSEELQLYKDCLKIFKREIKDSGTETRVVCVLPRISSNYKGMHLYVPLEAAKDEVEQYKERFNVKINIEETGAVEKDRIMLVILEFTPKPY